MNQYNPTALLAWRANMDISPCTDLAAVLGYVAKYCSKEETQTASYRDIALSLAPYLNELHVSRVSYSSSKHTSLIEKESQPYLSQPRL